MARGPRKHLKRLNAPSHWMLDKLSGHFAPRPSQGPHKLRECLPIIIFIRNRLKYALNYDEVKKIVRSRNIKVDGKVRTDVTYPSGFMDVITIEKTNEHFRLLYDCKGRFAVHRISNDESKYKLCRVKRVGLGQRGIPYITTHDGRTIRYPHPSIKVNDTVLFELKTGSILKIFKFESGKMAMVTSGRNQGRVGTITRKEKHLGSFDIVHLKDSNDHTFATRISNVFVIGDESKPYVTLPRGNGIRPSIMEDRQKRLGAKLVGLPAQ
ncbi:hypothetical protein MXB_1655 [Myxobolus squamalis]|nr:hypothetical protein MXB_1655 [Myxobolus squamalis]